MGLRLKSWLVANVVPIVVIGSIVAFVLWQLHPSLLLANTTPAGGDMGAHVHEPAFLRDHLLRHGRLTGWSPDWYGGYPSLLFYFPLPSLIIVLLSAVLPYGVAFKLVTVLGLVTLPVAAWVMGRFLDLPEPAPTSLAVATLPFLFERVFTIYGGNIPSTLAGEFAFSISLSLGVLFLGVMARALRTGRHRGAAATLLALTGLCHMIPTIFVLAGAVVLFLIGPSRARLRVLLPVLGASALLVAFWALPFLLRLPYTTDMGWEKTTTYVTTLFPMSLRWLALLALLGGALGMLIWWRVAAFLTGMAAVCAAGFVLAPQGRLWNARVLPFWFLCLYLLAGLFVAGIGHVVARYVVNEQKPGAVTWLTAASALLAALAYVAFPLHALPFGSERGSSYSWPGRLPLLGDSLSVTTTDRSFVPDWAAWNYSGYERKTAYPEYRDVVATMQRLGGERGCGRAMWEYEPELDRLGTPMALMLLPYWTNGCIGSMEGLFFESAGSTPYHFLNQSELSYSPSRAMRDLPYRNLDVASGVAHLKLLGVRYFMAIHPDTIAQADQNPDLLPLAQSGPWSVSYAQGGVKERTWRMYEVKDAAEVAPLAYEPAVLTNLPKGGRRWLDTAVAYYQDQARWDVPLAIGGPASWQHLRMPPSAPVSPVTTRSSPVSTTLWQRLTRALMSIVHGPATSTTRPPIGTVALPQAERRPLPPVSISGIHRADDRITFDVDRVGVPVVVKTSYFPNWQATGAKGPWRVAPNLMVVIPTSTRVSLHYGWTPVDVIGWALTFAGLAAVVVLSGRPLSMDEPRPEPSPGEDEWPHPENEAPARREGVDEHGGDDAPEPDSGPEPDVGEPLVPVGADDPAGEGWSGQSH